MCVIIRYLSLRSDKYQIIIDFKSVGGYFLSVFIQIYGRIVIDSLLRSQYYSFAENQDKIKRYCTIFVFLGHMQQGGSPTPFDRNMGTKMAAKSVEWMVNQLKMHTKEDGTVCAKSPDTAVMMGIVRRQYRFSPLLELKKETDFE